MTREEFIKVLDENEYSYEIQRDKIVVTRKGGINLDSLTSLPPEVEFKNDGWVQLDSLENLPHGVEFKNGGWVNLNSLTSLQPGAEFYNGGSIFLDEVSSLSPGIEFNNGGEIHLDTLIGGYISEWKGNIEGIDSKTLLNKMIQEGLLEKKRR